MLKIFFALYVDMTQTPSTIDFLYILTQKCMSADDKNCSGLNYNGFLHLTEGT